jgi:hypothetical protein
MFDPDRRPSRVHRAARLALTLSALLAVSRTAAAGPPLICHPFDAGNAATLPWGQGPGWNTPDRSYDVRRLTADTLRLLSPEAPVRARMENMRRAAIYASTDRRVAAELLAAVRARAQGSAGALAWFDAGYLIESYEQAASIHDRDRGSSGPLRAALAAQHPAEDGVALVKKALALAGPNAEMEYAASLMKRDLAAK